MPCPELAPRRGLQPVLGARPVTGADTGVFPPATARPHVYRRQFVALLSGSIPFAGCTGGRGDPITMLAVNRDEEAHTVTAWAVQGDRLAVANTVEVASRGNETIGEFPWRRGPYRVTVQLDGDVVIARKFTSDEWFNQLDVFIDGDGAASLERGRAG